jgi:hypothetical protein
MTLVLRSQKPLAVIWLTFAFACPLVKLLLKLKLEYSVVTHVLAQFQ